MPNALRYCGYPIIRTQHNDLTNICTQAELRTTLVTLKMQQPVRTCIAFLQLPGCQRPAATQHLRDSKPAAISVQLPADAVYTETAWLAGQTAEAERLELFLWLLSWV